MSAFSIIPILFYLLSLFILYLVIQAAVRNGINSSIVGKWMREKYDEESHDESNKDG